MGQQLPKLRGGTLGCTFVGKLRIRWKFETTVLSKRPWACKTPVVTCCWWSHHPPYQCSIIKSNSLLNHGCSRPKPACIFGIPTKAQTTNSDASSNSSCEMKNKRVQWLGKRIKQIISCLAFATSSVFFTTSEVIAMWAGDSVRFLLKRRAIAHQSSYHHGFPPRSWRKYFSSSLWFGRKMPNDEDISLLFHLITMI